MDIQRAKVIPSRAYGVRALLSVLVPLALLTLPVPAMSQVPTGHVTKSELLELPTWQRAYDEPSGDNDASPSALASVPAGASLKIVLGAWCPDSVREVIAFWEAIAGERELPFDVEYIAVDREMAAGNVDIDGLGIRAVPTFIVLRDGCEVGRVVERSVTSIDRHLVALLSGEATGFISATREAPSSSVIASREPGPCESISTPDIGRGTGTDE